MSEKDYIVLDVRSREEFEEGHVIGALNIPHNEIDDSIDLAKDKKIKVYCQSGMRSGIAAAILSEMGYNVEDMGAYDQVALDKE